MASSHVLYFPEIEFSNPSWVKYALCIWERVYRIVPLGYEPEDDVEVRTAVQEGLVVNVTLSQDDLTETADSFLAFLDAAEIIPAGLDVGLDERVRLHEDKIDDRVYAVLEPLSQHVTDGWLHLSRPLANAYMLYLAESVSRNRAMPKLASREDFFACMQFFSHDGNMDEFLRSTDSEETASALVIKSVLPGGIDQVDMETFLKHREGQMQARGSFRDAVADLVDSISGIDDDTVQVDLITEFEDRLTECQAASQNAFGQEIQDGVRALITAGVPVALSAYNAIGAEGNPFTYSRLGASVLIGMMAGLANTALARRSGWTSSEAVYYSKLVGLYGTNTTPTFPRYYRLLDEYIND